MIFSVNDVAIKFLSADDALHEVILVRAVARSYRLGRDCPDLRCRTLARQAGEAVSLATVYNTMRAFCQAGLMQEINVAATRSFFDTRMDEHPHYF